MTEDLASNYGGVYQNRLGFGQRPALILVDFVQAYFDPACPLYADVERELASALRIRDLAREVGVPVIYTTVAIHPLGLNGGRFFEKVAELSNMTVGHPMGAWAEGLEPATDELVVEKQYPSAFFGTSLSSTLTAGGIDTLLITGLTTSGCIRATCVDTISYGFRPIVVEDACGDRHPDPHAANLFDMNAKYGDVVSEAEAVTYLRELSRRT